MSSQNERPASRSLVFATVSFYMFAAIAMVLANKWVLMKTDIPVFFLFVQLTIAVILLAITKLAGLFQITFALDMETSKALVPMVAINVLGLNFNNMTLKYVDASMYQVARGLLLPITVAISGYMLHTRPSQRILISCGIVTVGFFIGVLIDSPNTTAAKPSSTSGPSFVGVFFGVLSSCTTALHAVVIKKSLDAVKGSTLQLAWYSNVLGAMAMLPIVIVMGEVPHIMDLFFGQDKGTTENGMSGFATFIWGSLLTGFVGFLINIAGLLSIKITSPITHMVSAAARGVLQTLFSVAFFADVITAGRATSIATILAGSIYYTWVKNEEQQSAQKNYTPLPTSAPQDSNAANGNGISRSDSVNSNTSSGGLHGRANSVNQENGNGIAMDEFRDGKTTKEGFRRD